MPSGFFFRKISGKGISIIHPTKANPSQAMMVTSFLFPIGTPPGKVKSKEDKKHPGSQPRYAGELIIILSGKLGD
jgi:hypothetical protein